LFLETMERVLGNSSKVIMDNTGGSGVVPYLPLNELQRPAQPNRPGEPPQAQAPAMPQAQPADQTAAPRLSTQGAAQ
jgi:membrane protease subunit HflK